MGKRQETFHANRGIFALDPEPKGSYAFGVNTSDRAILYAAGLARSS
jgi:hypothetical protein